MATDSLERTATRYDAPSGVLLAFALGLGLIGVVYQAVHPEPMTIWLLELALIVVPAAIILYAGHWLSTRPLNRAGRWVVAGGVLCGALLIDVFVGGYVALQHLTGTPVGEPGRLFLVGGLGGGVVVLSAAVPFQRHRSAGAADASAGSMVRPPAESGSSAREPGGADAVHIEFVGPPGAGKSVIHAALTEDPGLFGGDTDEAIGTVFRKRSGLKGRIAYQAMPSRPRSVVESEFLEYRLRYRALSEFLENYPDFPHLLSVAEAAVAHDAERIRPLCQPIAEQYQLGMTAIGDDEALCLDEGFVQRAVSVLWRRPADSFSLEEYFDAVPVPDVLIHVEAPDDVCLERQRRRGRVVTNEWGPDDPAELQRHHRESCARVCDLLATRTTVISVENTGDIDDVVERVRREIRQSG
ncbi:hypothetical protein [Halalkalicoccus tibetensis]|uniref:Thymidylate kinase n=1 Tax=Halalkalicoccus tibetensis TaxID=175632 RepID=A0ABD5V4Z7_9EURY